MSKKVVISNFIALKGKYGVAGVANIKTALKTVITADRARGLETSVIDVANTTAMRKVGGKKVVTPSSPKQNKDAVDAIYRASCAGLPRPARSGGCDPAHRLGQPCVRER